MRIAAAHSRVTPSIGANAAEITRLLEAAACAGADVVQFPEGALTGYVEHEITNPDWSTFDWSAADAALRQLAASCAELGLWAVIEGAVRSPGSARPFNSLHVISDRGELVARYDKRLCSHTEITDWFIAGAEPVVVEIGGLRLGFALCIEAQFPELFMEYERLGVELVCLSAYGGANSFEVQARGRAACNCFWISLSVHATGPDHPASCVIGPDGSVEATSGSTIPELALATIDPEDERWIVPCKYARPWRRKARGGEIYRSARDA